MGAKLRGRASAGTRPQSVAGRSGEAAERGSDLEPAVYAASALSAGAGLIHLWTTPEHFEDWWGYGIFFLAVAIAQGLLGVLVLGRPGRQLIYVLGIWGNLAVVCLYVMSRTVGIPLLTRENGVPLLGPHAGHLEDPGVLDMSATVAEVAVIIILVTLLDGVQRKRTINALLLAGVSIWALRLTGVLV